MSRPSKQKGHTPFVASANSAPKQTVIHVKQGPTSQLPQFTHQDYKDLQHLEKLRQQGQLSSPALVEKWQHLYVSYQNWSQAVAQHVEQHPNIKQFPSEPTVPVVDHNVPPTETSPNLPVQPVTEETSQTPSPEQTVTQMVVPHCATTKIETLEPEAAFTIQLNGTLYSLDSVDPTVSLLSWLRSLPNHKGTKKCCGEGGCGACTVMLTLKTIDNQVKNISVNSCLRPLIACNGMSVTTVQGIGDQKKGYHPIQTRLADGSGTQCGFCSPGMVMAMYSLLTNNPTPTQDEVERYFDGNICRCTGYRPIMTAFKTFAKDYNTETKSCKGACAKPGSDCKNACKFAKTFGDIEELPLEGEHFNKEYTHVVRHPIVEHRASPKTVGDVVWWTPTSLTVLYQLLTQYPLASPVFGHTSSGIFKDWQPSIFISLQSITELTGYTILSNSISFGACTTIADFLVLLNNFNNSPTFTAVQKSIFPDLIYSVGRVASSHIRNVGAIGGNIMLANKHSFPSDITIALIGLGASVIVGSSTGEVQVAMENFVTYDMTSKLLKTIILPLGVPNQIYHTYKVAIRSVFAHALVNSACSAIVQNNIISALPTIAFGNIRAKQSRMPNTEKFLVGRDLTNFSIFQAAVTTLTQELNPDPTIEKLQYRTNVALSMFYKFYLSLLKNVPPTLASAITRFIRTVSTGEQSFQSDPTEAPVSLPIPKLMGRQQTSGEAVYTDDIPTPVNTLHASFVISTNANADISSIDYSAALAIPGVKAWLSASDVPGVNMVNGDIPLFTNTTVQYSGQPIGIIVANTQEIADKAVAAVKVVYTNQRKPIITISDAIAAQSYWNFPNVPVKQGDVPTGLKESDFIFRGSVIEGSQIHVHMETHTTLAIPGEDNSIKLHAASQDTTNTQQAVASILNLPQSHVTVDVKRCGGGYGGKLSNQNYIAAAAALAATKLGVPVKMVMSLETNMSMVGRRPDHYAEYTVGITKTGMLKALEVNVYSNGGTTMSVGGIAQLLLTMLSTCYYVPNFLATAKVCKTNNPPHTSMRGPGWVPAVFFTEHIMEHVASFLSADPEIIKRQNFYTKGQITPDGTKLVNWNIDTIWTQLKASTNYDQRVADVATYNKQNIWTKRGISIVPVRFGVGWAGDFQSAEISVYADGSVLVTHSGVEIGQGIDTKVAQTVAYGLGIPMDIIKVGRHNSILSADVAGTGGSVTSALASKAALAAAQIIKQRLSPVSKLINETDWQKLVTAALSSGVDLTARGSVFPGPGPNSQMWQYQSYSACVQEVLVDILTGEVELLRTDILFDAGQSLNPAVDIGQIEGAFVMALGLYLTEEVTYSPDGRQVNNNTWTYRPFTARDIPLDIRVTLLANAPNPLGFLSSKCVGEPPMCLASSALFAVQHAVADAIKASGKDPKNFYLNSPATVDNVVISGGLGVNQFIIS